MRIAFMWWWGRAEEIYPYWRDGLRAAIEHIGRDHEVDIWLGEVKPNEDYDAYLIWGDSNCPAIEQLQDKSGKKGIILTTDPHNIENLKLMDVVFCESTPVYEAVRLHGIHAVKAFGTDTDFFTPIYGKGLANFEDIEFFYPATFSPWKRQRDIAHLGKRLYCVGTVQPDGQEDLQACLDNGVNVAQGYFKVELIRDLYRRAKNVMIPAIHGSERTVLEAMACGVQPHVMNVNNVRTRSYLKEHAESGLSLREFVVKNYNAQQYAEKILKGFL